MQVDILGLESKAATMFEQCGKQYGGGHCHSTTHNLVTIVLGIYSELLASACHPACHC